MNPFDAELNQRLAALRDAGLHRQLRRIDTPQSPHIRSDGQPLLNFSSNDYLGLANEPALQDAAARAARDFGAGSGASRLICGSLAPHHELEETLAGFKNTAAALTFSSGYAAAIGTVGALVGRGDTIVIDKLVHACIVDAARLSGARLRIFAHNDLNDLEDILKQEAQSHAEPESPRARTVKRPERHAPERGVQAASPFHIRKSQPEPRTLIVTESVFSMDGDHAPLRELVELKDRYGAWLMLDEAHATGLYGTHRRGLAEEAGVAGRIEVQMGTLGKALGSSGGHICGSRPLIDYLVNRARSFIFSTAPVPAAAAAATAAIRLLQSPAGADRCRMLWQRVAAWVASTGEAVGRSAILPWIVGSEAEAVQCAARLRERGIFVPAIRYPSVPRGKARLRITLTAAHTADDVAALASACEAIRNPQSAIHNA